MTMQPFGHHLGHVPIRGLRATTRVALAAVFPDQLVGRLRGCRADRLFHAVQPLTDQGVRHRRLVPKEGASATSWEHRLISGSGRLGALVAGDPSDEVITFWCADGACIRSRLQADRHSLSSC
jgi:hypothetical protein